MYLNRKLESALRGFIGMLWLALAALDLLIMAANVAPSSTLSIGQQLWQMRYLFIVFVTALFMGPILVVPRVPIQ
jgi:hypothetical protein